VIVDLNLGENVHQNWIRFFGKILLFSSIIFNVIFF
jgi:hypothetical protein